MNYFDYAATTPVNLDSLHVFRTVSEEFWGNPSSLHDTGGSALQLLTKCRETLADMLSVPSKGLYFTSGGTEGNHMALVTMALGRQKQGKHIIIGAGEHSSVHSSAAFLEKLGYSVSKIPLTSEGLIDLPLLEQAITDETTVISIGFVNGEIGTIQPLKRVKDVLGDRGILLHSDMVQAFGKIDISALTSVVDSFTLSSHKIYGPKGVGAVYIDPALALSPMIPGQSHEGGFRGGTVNLPGIAGFVAAASLQSEGPALSHYNKLRSYFLSRLNERIPRSFTLYEGPEDAQLPHVVGLGLHGIEGQWLMLECNRRGIAISTGSACGYGSMAKTMTAMAVSRQAGKEFIRISFGKDTDENQIDTLVSALSAIHTEHAAALT
ncbi:IscS subfamily cysteine desulfurase [Bacillus sp. KH172YL63]|uniref:IscS subfamily cysteine desulfurase n=1 Tax=Bacillus sp. KH172YL63 TaxID=2709784 RepID=UPI0013E4DB64|nr:IscS subfamily cysteine desulfurase [Bacillus sp. KH172YL63]BCB04978.1 cysteine desulfurase [Bacillus sp. KH172YL63]